MWGHSKSDHAHNICHLHNGTFSLSRLVFTIHSNHESTNSSLSDAAIGSILFCYTLTFGFTSSPYFFIISFLFYSISIQSFLQILANLNFTSLSSFWVLHQSFLSFRNTFSSVNSMLTPSRPTS